MKTLTLTLTPEQERHLAAVAAAVDLTPAQLAVAMVFQGFDSYEGDPAGFLATHPARLEYLAGQVTDRPDAAPGLADELHALHLLDSLQSQP